MSTARRRQGQAGRCRALRRQRARNERKRWQWSHVKGQRRRRRRRDVREENRIRNDLHRHRIVDEPQIGERRLEGAGRRRGGRQQRSRGHEVFSMRIPTEQCGPRLTTTVGARRTAPVPPVSQPARTMLTGLLSAPMPCCARQHGQVGLQGEPSRRSSAYARGGARRSRRGRSRCECGGSLSPH